MLYYLDLSPAQKRWVELVELFHQDKIIDGNISHKSLKEIHQFFVEKRKEDKRYKISWPIWLIMANQVSRGLYKFPAPELDVEEESTIEIDEEKEQFYISELLEMGITPKKNYFSEKT